MLLVSDNKLGGFGVVLYGELFCIAHLGGFINNTIWGDVPCAWIWRVFWVCIFETGYFDLCIWLKQP